MILELIGHKTDQTKNGKIVSEWEKLTLVSEKAPNFKDFFNFT